MFHRLSYNYWEWDDAEIYVNDEMTLTGAKVTAIT